MNQIGPYYPDKLIFNYNFSLRNSQGYDYTRLISVYINSSIPNSVKSYDPNVLSPLYNSFNAVIDSTLMTLTPNTSYSVFGRWYVNNYINGVSVEVARQVSVPFIAYTSPNSITAQFQSATDKASYFNFPSVDCSSFTVQSSLGTSQFPY
jgi:hypothetical protein